MLQVKHCRWLLVLAFVHVFSTVIFSMHPYFADDNLFESVQSQLLKKCLFALFVLRLYDPPPLVDAREVQDPARDPATSGIDSVKEQLTTMTQQFKAFTEDPKNMSEEHVGGKKRAKELITKMEAAGNLLGQFSDYVKQTEKLDTFRLDRSCCFRRFGTTELRSEMIEQLPKDEKARLKEVLKQMWIETDTEKKVDAVYQDLECEEYYKNFVKIERDGQLKVVNRICRDLEELNLVDISQDLKVAHYRVPQYLQGCF